MSGSHGVQVDDEQVGSEHTIRLRGELDIAGVPPLEAAVRRVFGAGTKSVTLDLSGLGFIDSMGLAAIVHLSGLCAKHNCEFAIVPGPPPVRRLFEVTGLDMVLPFAAAEGPGPA